MTHVPSSLGCRHVTEIEDTLEKIARSSLVKAVCITSSPVCVQNRTVDLRFNVTYRVSTPLDVTDNGAKVSVCRNYCKISST